MALKPDRNVIAEDISYFMFATGERGGVVCAVSGQNAEGAAKDDSSRRVAYNTAATMYAGANGVSGFLYSPPIGLLMTDVVNIDLSRQKINPYKNEVQIGDKVTIMTKGTAVTNVIKAEHASGGSFPRNAYVGPNGELFGDGVTDWATVSGYPLVGRFLTGVDSITNGYAEVEIDL